MNRTVEAVKYCVYTLKISIDELFSLIESSKDYTGDDNKRWFANEVIKIAEKEGIGYSQLLVRKFAIKSEILDSLDVKIKPEWIKLFSNRLMHGIEGGISDDNILSVNFDDIGNYSEDRDWYTDVDLMSYQSFSQKELSGTSILDSLQAGEDIPFAFIAKLDSGACPKNLPLVQSAKEYGIVCKNYGALLLYRMCNFIESWNIGSNFRFAFFTNIESLFNPENRDVISHFLKYFSYTGFTISSNILFTEPYMSGTYAYIVCSPREGSISDGFLLPPVKVKNDKFVIGRVLSRYSASSNLAIDALISHAPAFDCKVPVTRLGQLVSGEESDGFSEALGYLSIPLVGLYNFTVSVYPEVDSKVVIPITSDNLLGIIAYYGVTCSLSGSGFVSNIPEFIDGNPGYLELVYNCLPLFLFSTGSLFYNYDGKESVFDTQKSEWMLQFLDKATPYFSYEAKELMSICKGFLDFLGEKSEGMTFEMVRKESNNDDLNDAYMSALSNLKDYVRSLYRKIE